jgi:hypothetical protein
MATTIDKAKAEALKFLEEQDYIHYVDSQSILDGLLQRALEIESGLAVDLAAVDNLIYRLKSAVDLVEEA